MEDYGHIDVDTPSLAISLLPEYRGQGIGTKLLSNLLLGTDWTVMRKRGWRTYKKAPASAVKRGQSRSSGTTAEAINGQSY